MAIIASEASVAIIRNYSVAEKRKVGLSDELINIIKCSFSNCITQNEREPLPHKLIVVNKSPVEIRCAYCGKIQDISEIPDYII